MNVRHLHAGLIGGLVGLTLLVIAFTIGRVEIYPTFYAYQDKPLGSPATLGLLLGLAVVIIAGARRRPVPAWLFLPAAVAVGTALQFGFAWTEGRGIDGIRSRASAGHGRFIVDALATDDAAETLRRYEDLVAREKLGQFPRSKPPGTLLFYVLTERVSRLFVTHTYNERRRWERFVDFLVIAWPVVAALAVVPLYGLARRLGDEADARIAVALYLLVPSFSLVTLHTDQVLFPLLFLAVLVLFTWASAATADGPVVVRGFATGLVLCLAAFCHFPLALAVVVCGALSVASVAAGGGSLAPRARQAGLLAASGAAGMIVPSIALWALFNYNPIVRWRAALAFHAAWRGVPAVVDARDALNNVAEFIDWMGVPVAGLALGLLVVGRTSRRAPWSHLAVLASLVGLVVYLAFFSRTVAEVARLWLFLMPLACVAAARTLREVGGTFRWAVPLVLALQFASVYVIKTLHDFW